MKLQCSLFFLLLTELACSVSCMSVADVDGLTWDEWGECSRPCGGGTRYRKAVCDPRLEPQTCLYMMRTLAREQLREKRTCNTQACTGTWGDWTDWQSCSSTCGSSAFQKRTRSCYDGNNVIQGSVNCDGLPYEQRSCQGLPPCPSDTPSEDLNYLLEEFEMSYSSLQSFDKVSEEEDLQQSEKSFEEYPSEAMFSNDESDMVTSFV